MDQKLSIRIETKTSGIKKELERTILSMGEFILAESKDRPDLLIYELGDAPAEEFKLLQSIVESDTVGEVFVTSRQPDTELLLKVMRAGIKEFFPQPLNAQDIKAALAALVKRRQQTAKAEPAHYGRIIHVMGAKGGVGTTTIAVNLAMILSDLKKAGSVALVDLNTVFGEIPLFLSVKPKYHWGHIAGNMNRLDRTFLMNAMAKHASGLHILPSPSYLNGHPPATAENMENLLNVMKSNFDYIIVDGGQALNGPAMKVIEMSQNVLLVTLLSLPCLTNTKNVIKSLAGREVYSEDRLGLIVNRYLKNSDLTLQEAQESVRTEIFWNIPNDYKTTMSAINRGVPLHNLSPKASITKSLVSMADAFLDDSQKDAKPKRWGLFSK
jgi:pilus assembly protein CpaE